MAERAARLFGASRTHLSQARESYWAHLRFAATVGSMMMAAGLACCVHAVVPGICRDTASRTIGCLGAVLEDRSSLDRAAAETAEAVAFAFLTAMAVAVGMSLWLVGAGALVALLLTAAALALPLALLATSPDLAGDPAGPLARTARRAPGSDALDRDTMP